MFTLMGKRTFSHWRSKLAGTLSGKMLVAHPLLEEKQFAKTLMLVETDTGHGISGIILNRPLNIMLKTFGSKFENLFVSNVPVYYGGEHGKTTVMLSAWVLDQKNKVFEIYCSLDNEDAKKLVQTGCKVQFRAFLGFCSFKEKIYDDIEKGLWIVGDVRKLFGAQKHEEALWQTILLQENPNALVLLD
jgi:putative transcriptional regulator